MRVAPRNKSELQSSGLLDGRSCVSEYILSFKKLDCVIFRKKAVTDYNINKVVTTEQYKQDRTNLTMDFGNTRKRKALDATVRRRIGDESMSVMNSSVISQMMNETNMDVTGEANSTFKSENGDLKDISLLKTVRNSIHSILKE